MRDPRALIQAMMKARGQRPAQGAGMARRDPRQMLQALAARQPMGGAGMGRPTAGRPGMGGGRGPQPNALRQMLGGGGPGAGGRGAQASRNRQMLQRGGGGGRGGLDLQQLGGGRPVDTITVKFQQPRPGNGRR